METVWKYCKSGLRGAAGLGCVGVVAWAVTLAIVEMALGLVVLVGGSVSLPFPVVVEAAGAVAIVAMFGASCLVMGESMERED